MFCVLLLKELNYILYWLLRLCESKLIVIISLRNLILAKIIQNNKNESVILHNCESNIMISQYLKSVEK